MCVVLLAALVAAFFVFGVFAAVDQAGERNSNANATACETDVKTLQTAEEAYYAKGNGTYGTYEQLVAGGFVIDSGADGLHTVTVSVDGTSYALTGTPKSNCHSNYTSPPSAHR